MTVLKILDRYSPDKRESTVVLALVMQGEPRIGMVFKNAESGGKCKLIGVGPMGGTHVGQDNTALTLHFAPVDGTYVFREGELLTEDKS